MTFQPGTPQRATSGVTTGPTFAMDSSYVAPPPHAIRTTRRDDRGCRGWRLDSSKRRQRLARHARSAERRTSLARSRKTSARSHSRCEPRCCSEPSCGAHRPCRFIGWCSPATISTSSAASSRSRMSAALHRSSTVNSKVEKRSASSTVTDRSARRGGGDASVRALGFGADEITLVRRLRCYGCPAEPF